MPSTHQIPSYLAQPGIGPSGVFLERIDRVTPHLGKLVPINQVSLCTAEVLIGCTRVLERAKWERFRSNVVAMQQKMN